MSKYRLSIKDKRVLFDEYLHPQYEAAIDGFSKCEKILIPLLEEKDQLLRECRGFIEEIIPTNPLEEKNKYSLLAKLNSL